MASKRRRSVGNETDDSPSKSLTLQSARRLARAELLAAQSRIDDLLAHVDPDPCSSCAALQHQVTLLETEVAELRAQAALHSKERHAWQQFKTWWLNSLSKHQRRSPITSVIANLDNDANRIWTDAGILPLSPTKRKSSTLSKASVLAPSPANNNIVAAASKSPKRSDSRKRNSPHDGQRVSNSSRRGRQDSPRLDESPTARNKFARRAMIAHDCPDCQLFYTHLGADAATEKQACSRHRTTHQRATTPQGYWNIGFPTTQDALQINQQARQHHT